MDLRESVMLISLLIAIFAFISAAVEFAAIINVSPWFCRNGRKFRSLRVSLTTQLKDLEFGRLYHSRTFVFLKSKNCPELLFARTKACLAGPFTFVPICFVCRGNLVDVRIGRVTIAAAVVMPIGLMIVDLLWGQGIGEALLFPIAFGLVALFARSQIDATIRCFRDEVRLPVSEFQ